MEEVKVTEEVKQEEVVQPAPAVEAKAIEQNNTEVVEQPKEKEVVQPEPKDNKEGLSKGIKSELYKLRAERRELRETVETLKKQFNEKTNVVNKTVEEPPSIFDDADKRLAYERQSIKNEIMADFQKAEVEKIRNQQLEQEGQQTIEMLLKKPEINGSMEMIEEIDEIILNDSRLTQIVKISPELAGKEAFEMWKKDKGIDTQSKASVASARAATSAPSASSMTAKPALSRTDIQAEAAKLDPSDPDFNKKWQSLLEQSLKV